MRASLPPISWPQWRGGDRGEAADARRRGAAGAGGDGARARRCRARAHDITGNPLRPVQRRTQCLRRARRQPARLRRGAGGAAAVEGAVLRQGGSGELAEDLGRGDEALRWRAEAYAEAVGAATRFQWGQSYASALLRIAPGNEARIRDVTLDVLGELDGPDRIYRRARLRLERLGHELVRWNTGAGGQALWRAAGTARAHAADLSEDPAGGAGARELRGVPGTRGLNRRQLGASCGRA